MGQPEKRQYYGKLLYPELSRLLESSSMNKICLGDLLKACHISKTVFYRYFNDVYDLLQWGIIQEYQNLISAIGPDTGLWESVNTLMCLIFEKHDFNLNIAACMTQQQMRTLFHNNWIDLLRQAVLHDIQTSPESKKPSDKQLNLLLDFFIEGMAGLIFLNQEHPSEYPQEQIMETIRIMTEQTLAAARTSYDNPDLTSLM